MRSNVIILVTGLFILYYIVNIIYDLLFLFYTPKKECEEVIEISHLVEDPINAEDIVKEERKRREQELKAEELQRKEAAEKLKAEDQQRKAEEEAKSQETLNKSTKEFKAAQEQKAKEREESERLEAADIATRDHITNVSSHDGCSLKSLVDRATKDRDSNILANISVC